MAGSAWCLWHSAIVGQGGNRPVQGIAQIMQCGGLQSQRQSTDVQVDEAAAFTVLDVGDESVG